MCEEISSALLVLAILLLVHTAKAANTTLSEAERNIRYRFCQDLALPFWVENTLYELQRRPHWPVLYTVLSDPRRWNAYPYAFLGAVGCTVDWGDPPPLTTQHT